MLSTRNGTLWNKNTFSLSRGTLTGVTIRWGLWPLEYIYTAYSFPHNTKAYPQLFRETFTFEQLKDLNTSFWRTGFRQTLLKSLSNSGVLDLVDTQLAPRFHWTAVEKGLVIALIGSPVETIATTTGQKATVNSFVVKQQGISFKQQESKLSYSVRLQQFYRDLFTSESSRIFSASFIRSFGTSVTTFVGIYKTADAMKLLFPNMKDHHRKPIAAGTAAAAVQPINIVFINWLNYCILNSNKKTTDARKDFFGTGPTLFDKAARTRMTRGTLIRTVFSSTRYTANFFLLELFKGLRPAQNNDDEKPLIKKPR
jgi:hypothetical protein